jgi:hypothetical protein
LDIHAAKCQVSRKQVSKVQDLKIHVSNIQIPDNGHVLENLNLIQANETTKCFQELKWSQDELIPSSIHKIFMLYNTLQLSLES